MVMLSFSIQEFKPPFKTSFLYEYKSENNHHLCKIENTICAQKKVFLILPNSGKSRKKICFYSKKIFSAIVGNRQFLSDDFL